MESSNNSNKTLGQIAYEARYSSASYRKYENWPDMQPGVWGDLDPLLRQSYEDVAQAVIHEYVRRENPSLHELLDNEPFVDESDTKYGEFNVRITKVPTMPKDRIALVAPVKVISMDVSSEKKPETPNELTMTVTLAYTQPKFVVLKVTAE